MAAQAQLTQDDVRQLHEAAHVARSDVKRLASQTRRSVRSLAQLEAKLQELGIGIEITALGGTDE